MVNTAALPGLDESLRAAIEQMRGHAVRVAGPEGAGQFDWSLALARAWLCEAQGAQRPGPLACGTCTACRLVDARTHPDLRVLVPEAQAEELGWAAPEEGADSGEGRRKPSREIKVDALRAAVEFAQQTSSRGQAKVVLIHPAERMNAVAANTLLKTLEEPPGQARFILSGGEGERLLPTLRSRCQTLVLGRPPEAQAQAWLQAQGWAPDDARVLLRAAGGLPLQALSMARAGVDAKAWQALPERVRSGDAAALASWPLPELVKAFQKLCHDSLCKSVGAPARYFDEASLPAGAELSALQVWSESLAALARHAEHPWSGPLAVEALVIQAQRAMRTPTSAPQVINSKA